MQPESSSPVLPVDLEKLTTGKVERWLNSEGWGFIEPDGDFQKIVVERSEIMASSLLFSVHVEIVRYKNNLRMNFGLIFLSFGHANLNAFSMFTSKVWQKNRVWKCFVEHFQKLPQKFWRTGTDIKSWVHAALSQKEVTVGKMNR